MWQYSVWVVPLAAATISSLGMFAFVVVRRPERIGRSLAAVLLFVSIWAGADTVRFLATTERLKLLANDFRFVGAAYVVVAMFVLVLQYTDRDYLLTPRRIVLLVVVPTITVTLAFTNQYHHLVRESGPLTVIGLPVTGDLLVHLPITYGPWYYYVHLVYSYPLLIVSAYFLLARYFNPDVHGVYRMQSLLLFLSFFLPIIPNLVNALGLFPLDLTAFGFVLTSLTLTVAVFRYDLNSLRPVAHSTVVQNVDAGVLVFDTESTVIDVNPRGSELLDADRSTLIGNDLETVFSGYPTVVETFGDVRRTRTQISLELAGETKHYDVTVSPLFDGDRYLGRVVIFRDVTPLERTNRELQHRREELERQNERLEDFARIVTHDLRNPLNVAKGRLALVQQKVEGEDIDHAVDAIDRMADLIEDVRTMAVQGQTVSDTDRVDLREVATDAWRTADTADARLEVTDDTTLEADRSSLMQLFENLFRNAVDHGPPNVTVRVGPTDDGFFVADDGPGIPVAERERVLEDGYTTADAGTGFGLSIVRTIAGAHGWSVVVTGSEEGGARFDVRDDTERTTTTASLS